MKFKAAVIGLGKIGQGYDYDCHDESFITTHSSAYNYHPSFELVAGVDINLEFCHQFEKKYKKQVFHSVNEMMAKLNPDIISIATPTDTHLDIFNQLIPYSPKAIILEKPMAVSVKQAQKIITIAKEEKIALIVNYIRRFEQGTNNLKDLISNDVIGDIYKGVVWYCKGLKNNGSHFIDLLMYFFGDIKQIKLINKGRKFDTLGYDDYEPDFQLEFSDKKIIFQSTCSEYFSLGEFILIGTKGTIFYQDNKIEYSLTKPDPINKGYTILKTKPSGIATGFERYQYFVMDCLSEYFENNGIINSDGNSASKTLKVLEQIIGLR